jgi:hypothetical protein
MDKLLESDWKTFRKLVPEWRERYLEVQNQRLAAMLVEGTNTPTERFWNAEKEMKAVARILVTCLDGHSRSNMEMHLLLMYRHKMIGNKDLEDFSGDFRESLMRVIEGFSG